jgi:hypothetical protein
MGWMKESLEEMKKAKAKAMAYGNTEERKVVISSLAHLEQEIENEDGSNESLLFLILLIGIIRRIKLKNKNFNKSF